MVCISSLVAVVDDDDDHLSGPTFFFFFDFLVDVKKALKSQRKYLSLLCVTPNSIDSCVIM